jgi:hypothetical protein
MAAGLPSYRVSPNPWAFPRDFFYLTALSLRNALEQTMATILTLKPIQILFLIGLALLFIGWLLTSLLVYQQVPLIEMAGTMLWSGNRFLEIYRRFDHV